MLKKLSKLFMLKAAIYHRNNGHWYEANKMMAKLIRAAVKEEPQATQWASEPKPAAGTRGGRTKKQRRSRYRR